MLDLGIGLVLGVVLGFDLFLGLSLGLVLGLCLGLFVGLGYSMIWYGMVLNGMMWYGIFWIRIRIFIGLGYLTLHISTSLTLSLPRLPAQNRYQIQPIQNQLPQY